MNIAEAAAEVSNRFLTYWAGRTIVGLENEPDFSPPEDDSDWLATFTSPVLNNFAALGNKKTRNQMIYTVEVNVPSGSYTSDSNVYVTDIVSFFRAYTNSPIRVMDILYDKVGTVDMWFRQNVIVTLQFDDYAS